MKRKLFKGTIRLTLLASFLSLAESRLYPQIYNWTTIAGAPGPSNSGSADGTNGSAQFNTPLRLALNGGNIYVADFNNFTIRQVRPIGTNWVVSTIAGQAGIQGSADGTNNVATFGNPSAIAGDASGNLYVTDFGGNSIRRLVASGTNWIVSTISGLGGLNGSADGTNQSARFNGPNGIAVDNNGNLYVADQNNSTIRKITRFGTNWVTTTIAGLAGSYGSADGTNSAARFNNPVGISVDTSGNLYLADGLTNTIRKIRPAGTNWVVATIAGTAGISGSADGTNGAALFYAPWGTAVDGMGNVYVADAANSTIRKITPVGTNWVVTTIGGRATFTDAVDGTNSAARFKNANGVFADGLGDVYVADTGNNIIRFGSNQSPPQIQFTIQRPSINSVKVFWTSPSTGLSLQTNSNLRTTNWAAAAFPISDNGLTRSVTLSPPVGNLFFRLHTN